MAAFTLTIDSASVGDGRLNVLYTKNGDSGNGISWETARLSEYELNEGNLESFILSAILTFARRKNLTPAQITGKTITLNLSNVANLLTVS